jgi:hypothetical protein
MNLLPILNKTLPCDVLSIKPVNLINNPFECLSGSLASGTCPLLLHEYSQSPNQVIHRTLGHNWSPPRSPPEVPPISGLEPPFVSPILPTPN